MTKSTTGSGLLRRFRGVALPFAAVRLSGQAIEFIGWILLARRLDPDGFGQLSIAFLICRYAGVVADWGALVRGSRDVAAAGRHGSVHDLVRRRTMLTVGLTAAAVVLFVATGFAYLAPVALVIPNLGISRDFIALGNERGVRSAVPSLVEGLLFAGGALLVHTIPAGAVVVGVAYGATALLSVVLNPLAPRAGHEAARNPDAWILLAYIATQLAASVDTLLLGAMRSVSEAGIYVAVYRIPNAWLSILTALVVGSLPLVTRALHADAENYTLLLKRALRTSGAAAGLLLAATPIAWWLVPVLLGDAYESGRAPVVILMVAMAVYTFVSPLISTALAGGVDRAYAVAQGFMLLVNLALNIALIPTFGMVGAALATLASQIALLPPFFRIARHLRPAPRTPGATPDPAPGATPPRPEPA